MFACSDDRPCPPPRRAGALAATLALPVALALGLAFGVAGRRRGLAAAAAGGAAAAAATDWLACGCRRGASGDGTAGASPKSSQSSSHTEAADSGRASPGDGELLPVRRRRCRAGLTDTAPSGAGRRAEEWSAANSRATASTQLSMNWDSLKSQSGSVAAGAAAAAAAGAAVTGGLSAAAAEAVDTAGGGEDATGGGGAGGTGTAAGAADATRRRRRRPHQRSDGTAAGAGETAGSGAAAAATGGAAASCPEWRSAGAKPEPVAAKTRRRRCLGGEREADGAGYSSGTCGGVPAGEGSGGSGHNGS